MVSVINEVFVFVVCEVVPDFVVYPGKRVSTIPTKR